MEIVENSRKYKTSENVLKLLYCKTLIKINNYFKIIIKTAHFKNLLDFFLNIE